MFYSSTIFSAVPDFNPSTGTAIVGVVNMVATLGSAVLLTYFGRKSLLWTCSFMMSADLVALGIGFIKNIVAL